MLLPFGFDDAKTLVAGGVDAIQVFCVAAFECPSFLGGQLVQLRGLFSMALGDAVELHAPALFNQQSELARLFVEAVGPVIA